MEIPDLLGGTSLYIETVGIKGPEKEGKSGGGFRVTGLLLSVSLDLVLQGSLVK